MISQFTNQIVVVTGANSGIGKAIALEMAAQGAVVCLVGRRLETLLAIADSLREEVNTDQVRVISVFPGRTATPLQAKIHEMEGKIYHPERLIQPEDVASVVINALSLPSTAEVTDISICPFTKPLLL